MAYGFDEIFRYGDIGEIGPAYLPGGVRGPPYERPGRNTIASEIRWIHSLLSISS